jgi:hypothetical protein
VIRGQQKILDFHEETATLRQKAGSESETPSGFRFRMVLKKIYNRDQAFFPADFLPK